MRALSIGYHDVLLPGQSPDMTLRARPDRYALSLDAFREHLRRVELKIRRVSTVDAYLQAPQGCPVFLTFDDGALGAYTCVADALEAKGWRGHFFVVSDWIGRRGFVDARQIRELRKRGHSIGTHSRSHPRMSQMRRTELLAEWTDSRNLLSDILGENVPSASVPNGYYTRLVGSTAAGAGIQALFTSEPTTRIGRLDQCLILGRYSVKAETPARVSGALAAGSIWPRWNQTVAWQAKKVVKRLAGKSYGTVRRWMLPHPASE